MPGQILTDAQLEMVEQMLSAFNNLTGEKIEFTIQSGSIKIAQTAEGKVYVMQLDPITMEYNLRTERYDNQDLFYRSYGL